MQLRRSPRFFTAYFEILLTAKHIPGVCNTTADQLSRNQMITFFTMNPHASRVPTHLPAPIQQIISPEGQDWTSQDFCKLFSLTISNVLHTYHKPYSQRLLDFAIHYHCT